MAKGKRSADAPRRPEKKYGPFHGGVGLAVWLNQVKANGDDEPRFFRSVTINPRRYRDEKTGEWMDSISFRATDLPALILALEAAHRYMLDMPLPGEPVEDDVIDALATAANEIPM